MDDGDEPACVWLLHAEPVSAVVRDFDHLTKLQYLRLIHITNYKIMFDLNMILFTLQAKARICPLKRTGRTLTSSS